VPLGKALNDNLPPVQRRHDCDGMGRLAVLVDDDTMVLMGLRVLFQEWGYDVLIAGSTDQAVELLQTAERIPDIVIADYRLRDGRFGTETIQSIRSLFDRPIPGLILTGEIGSDCQDDVARHGFEIIYKPVVPKHLAQLLHRHTQHA
jgi:CheY-like chemotaxis protein